MARNSHTNKDSAPTAEASHNDLIPNSVHSKDLLSFLPHASSSISRPRSLFAMVEAVEGPLAEAMAGLETDEICINVSRAISVDEDRPRR